MDDTDLLTIGRFARLTGLSIHALRNYDDVSLLIPAHTDPQTGYRRYGRDQIRLAHSSVNCSGSICSSSLHPERTVVVRPVRDSV